MAAYDFGIHVDSRGRGQVRTTNVTIARNRVKGCSPNGLLLQHTENIRVLDNELEDSGLLDGIGVAPGCIGCIVEGNTAGGAPPPPSIWNRSKTVVAALHDNVPSP